MTLWLYHGVLDNRPSACTFQGNTSCLSVRICVARRSRYVSYAQRICQGCPTTASPIHCSLTPSAIGDRFLACIQTRIWDWNRGNFPYCRQKLVYYVRVLASIGYVWSWYEMHVFVLYSWIGTDNVYVTQPWLTEFQQRRYWYAYFKVVVLASITQHVHHIMLDALLQAILKQLVYVEAKFGIIIHKFRLCLQWQFPCNSLNFLFRIGFLGFQFLEQTKALAYSFPIRQLRNVRSQCFIIYRANLIWIVASRCNMQLFHAIWIFLCIAVFGTRFQKIAIQLTKIQASPIIVACIQHSWCQ